MIFWLDRDGYSGVYASSDPANVPDTEKRLPGGSLVRNARGGAVTMNAGCLWIPQIADYQSAEELNVMMAEVGLLFTFREVR